MKNLYDIIEGLLDDEDDLVNDNKDFAKAWIEDNCTGKYKVMYLKDGTLKLSSGKLVIKGYKEANFPPYINFSSIVGDIVIEKCPNLTSIAGLIKDPEYMTMKGSLTIGNCPKFISLEGLPHILDGDFTLVGNTSLKNLEHAPEMVFGDITFMKNGKRFKEKDVQNYIKYSRRLDCSLDDEEVMESLVNEALNEPHLLKLAKTLREIGMSFATYVADEIGYHLAWDDVDSSHVDTYNTSDATQLKLGMREVRNICADKYRSIAIGEANGEYQYVLLPGKRILNIGYKNRPYREQTSYIANYFESCDKIVIINLPSELSKFEKHIKRVNNREGVYEPGNEIQYRNIARANIKRYKEIIAQNKANKDKGYEEISKIIENCLQRYMKATMAVNKNPDKYADSYYSLATMNEIITGRETYGRGGTYGQDGIMTCYERYNESRVRIFKKSEYSNKDYYMQNVKAYEKKIKALADRLEGYFKQFGV